MKNLIYSFLLFALPLSSNAQDSTSSYKRNDFSMIAPGVFGFSNSPGIMYKRIYDHSAFRLQAIGTFNYSKDATYNPAKVRSSYSFSLKPGKEWFKGKRFQYYYGIDGILNYSYSHFTSNTTVEHESKGYNFGIAPLAGLRFFIFKEFHIGVEYSYNLTYGWADDKYTFNPSQGLPMDPQHSISQNFYLDLRPTFWVGFKF
jgi:hypothetical protein